VSGASGLDTSICTPLPTGSFSARLRVELLYVALVIPFVHAIVHEHVPVGGVIESMRALIPAGIPVTLRKKIGSVFTAVGTDAPGVITAARTYVYAPESGIVRCAEYEEPTSKSVTFGVAPAFE
jgi:hypothetical protein